jgi:carboxyl-terminal processing protease
MPIHPTTGLTTRLARAAALAGLLALASCGGGAPEANNAGQSPDDKLFGYTFHQIDALYIRPVSGQTLITAAVAHLNALDPAFAAAAGPGVGSQASLVIAYHGKTVGSFAVPDTNNPAEMTAFLDRVLSIARSVSPRIAAAPQETVDHAVFNGITAALDRFSRYSPPELAREQRDERNGFGGIGITLDSSNDEFRITQVDPRGPADRAGIHAGDRVAAIDGTQTAKHSRAWVVQHLRGAIGSPITVAVLRGPGAQTHEYHFQRDRVIRPSVTISHDGGIAVFRIAIFNQSTTEQIASALRAGGDHITGVILDVRGNPGGLLEQAVTLAELFVQNGPIIATVGRIPASHQFFAASGHAIAPRVPIVVLVNGGSASASEILAAALQDLGRAVVVGSSSYGKGTVQTVMRLPNDGELTLTWARLITPSGYLLQDHGVVPTICTGDLAGNAGALDSALQRAKQPPPSPPRAGLDEAGWRTLRRTCPLDHESPPVDVAVAERMLGEPALYASALGALPAATELVQKSADAASGLALTGSDRALNSPSR